MKLVTDCSYYNSYSTAQYDLLSANIDGVIIRAGFGVNVDAMMPIHLKEFQKRGIPTTFYWWADPIRSLDQQIGYIVSTMRDYNAPSIYLDFEQFWGDWTAYMGWLAGKVPAANIPIIPNSILNKFYKELFTRVKGYGKPTGSYSADWFIDKYCPSLRDWVFTENYWQARYQRWYDNAWYLSKIKELGSNFTIQDVSTFAERAGVTRGIGTQFESLLPVSGLNKNQDWNVFTNAGFNTMFGTDYSHEEDPITEPEPVKSFVVNVYAVWAREQPNDTAKQTGFFWKGDMVDILSVSGGWGKTDKGWVYLSNLSPLQGMYIVTTPIYVRDQPMGKIVSYKMPGAQVQVFETAAGWGKIAGGWVSMKYLRIA
jgi:hypothetical protein